MLLLKQAEGLFRGSLPQSEICKQKKSEDCVNVVLHYINRSKDQLRSIFHLQEEKEKEKKQKEKN